jgi:hypothetical protein
LSYEFVDRPSGHSRRFGGETEDVRLSRLPNTKRVASRLPEAMGEKMAQGGGEKQLGSIEKKGFANRSF